MSHPCSGVFGFRKDHWPAGWRRGGYFRVNAHQQLTSYFIVAIQSHTLTSYLIVAIQFQSPLPASFFIVAIQCHYKTIYSIVATQSFPPAVQLMPSNTIFSLAFSLLPSNSTFSPAGTEAKRWRDSERDMKLQSFLDKCFWDTGGCNISNFVFTPKAFQNDIPLTLPNI